MGWPLLFPILQKGYKRQHWERDGVYDGRPFPHRNVSDNGSPESWKSIMISSAFDDMVEKQ